MTRLSLLYRIPRRELEQRMSREEVLELMAYDLKYGLPDNPKDKLPAPPIKRWSREPVDPMKIFRALKTAYNG